MYKLWATCIKELLQLSRDRAGLAVLFLMPMALVLVVSLVQNNILQTTGEGGIRVLYLNCDQGDLGRQLRENLEGFGTLEIDTTLQGHVPTPDEARLAVVDGDYQFCVILPEGTSDAFYSGARRMAQSSLHLGDSPAKAEAGQPAENSGLQIYFDPAVRGAFRSVVTSSLQRVLMGMEIEERSRILAEMLPKKLNQLIEDQLGLFAFVGGGDIPKVDFSWDRTVLLPLEEKVAAPVEWEHLPTSVQQNVPAWALFGMFFIVVPLGGALIRERQEGTMQRLLTVPGSVLPLLGGKVAAYVLVCMVQFVMMLAVGRYILPLLGTPVLEVGSDVLALMLLALCAALAATGFGIMVGTLARSYEQASMFGAVSVVIAAALGGVMVPVYVMPRMMQAIAEYSPLAWGLNGFLELFVRGGSLNTVWLNMMLLLAFFVGTLLVAWIGFLKSGHVQR